MRPYECESIKWSSSGYRIEKDGEAIRMSKDQCEERLSDNKDKLIACIKRSTESYRKSDLETLETLRITCGYIGMRIAHCDGVSIIDVKTLPGAWRSIEGLTNHFRFEMSDSVLNDIFKNKRKREDDYCIKKYGRSINEINNAAKSFTTKYTISPGCEYELLSNHPEDEYLKREGIITPKYFSTDYYDKVEMNRLRDMRELNGIPINGKGSA